MGEEKEEEEAKNKEEEEEPLTHDTPDSRLVLKYRLEGHLDAASIEAYGSEYSRALAAEIGREFEARMADAEEKAEEEGDETQMSAESVDIGDLMPIITAVVP